MEDLLAALRAAAEPTRLRLIAVLSRGEMTVTELTQILRQSQPRVSRHLKLMCEAGLLERFREGSWVFYRIADSGTGAALVARLMDLMPMSDVVIARDFEKLEAVRAARVERAAAYFRENAAAWDEIRALHLPEAAVERAMEEAVGGRSIDFLVDLGTGTGRILEVLGGHARAGVGIDLSPEMLAIARTRLEAAKLDQCHVRQGSLFDLPFDDGEADLVTVHQVLHYLDDPAAAIGEAARILAPGGRLLIADFAPHDLDFLRDQHAHRRLGFSTDQVAGWCRQFDLTLTEARELPPPDEGGKLTVMVWVADKPAVPQREIETQQNKKQVAV